MSQVKGALDTNISSHNRFNAIGRPFIHPSMMGCRLRVKVGQFFCTLEREDT